MTTCSRVLGTSKMIINGTSLSANGWKTQQNVGEEEFLRSIQMTAQCIKLRATHGPLSKSGSQDKPPKPSEGR